MSSLYTVRIYLKSGNMVELENLKSFKFNTTVTGKTASWEHHDDHEGFMLLGGGTLDLDQIEAITHKTQLGFKQI